MLLPQIGLQILVLRSIIVSPGLSSLYHRIYIRQISSSRDGDLVYVYTRCLNREFQILNWKLQILVNVSPESGCTHMRTKVIFATLFHVYLGTYGK